jgi:hypothetical protein
VDLKDDKERGLNGKHLLKACQQHRATPENLQMNFFSDLAVLLKPSHSNLLASEMTKALKNSLHISTRNPPRKTMSTVSPVCIHGAQNFICEVLT